MNDSTNIHILILGRTGISSFVQSWIQPQEDYLRRAVGEADAVEGINFVYERVNYESVELLEDKVDRAHAVILNFGTRPAKSASQTVLRKYHIHREKMVVLYTAGDKEESDTILKYERIEFNRVIAIPLDVIRGHATAAQGDTTNAQTILISALSSMGTHRSGRDDENSTNEKLRWVTLLSTTTTKVVAALSAVGGFTNWLKVGDKQLKVAVLARRRY